MLYLFDELGSDDAVLMESRVAPPAIYRDVRRLAFRSRLDSQNFLSSILL